MKNTKQTKVENTYIPPPLGASIKWWNTRKLRQEVRTSFNEELYFQYLQAQQK